MRVGELFEKNILPYTKAKVYQYHVSLSLSLSLSRSIDRKICVDYQSCPPLPCHMQYCNKLCRVKQILDVYVRKIVGVCLYATYTCRRGNQTIFPPIHLSCVFRMESNLF